MENENKRKTVYGTTFLDTTAEAAAATANNSKATNNKRVNFITSLKMRQNVIVTLSVVTAVIVVAAIVFVLYSTRTPPTEERRCYYCSHGNQSKLGDICSPSELGKYHQFAISTDSNVCAPAGK